MKKHNNNKMIQTNLYIMFTSMVCLYILCTSTWMCIVYSILCIEKFFLFFFCWTFRRWQLVTHIKFNTLDMCTLHRVPSSIYLVEKFRIEIVYSYAYRQGNAVIVYNLDVNWLALFFFFFSFFYYSLIFLQYFSFNHFRRLSFTQTHTFTE